ncbi:MAG: 3-phosphoglycerate dehydrogenase [Rhodospirillales bacterium CG15_BIG_FIL_POST_REV_8_21_14_020_66_15]|nr:MAG: 3-phosphoglycerate dehydrogenase [Rhodospirillales bacterium CG15_BIG_FIL_POST_REV_8_21_14_020_66_15]
MAKTLVYFEKWMDPVALDVLAPEADIAVERLRFEGDDTAAWTALERAHGYQLMPSTETPRRWFPTRDLIVRCPNLLAISSTGAGYDMVDVAACTEHGVMVVNNSGANSVSVAQHVMGMALALSKQIAQTDKAIRRDAAVDRFEYIGEELTGKVVGIVGLGNIGRLVSAYMKPFGARVIACDPYISDADFAERGAEKVDFETLFREADIVSINCPLTAETRGMVDARAFSQMKPTAYFITTARGGIHDEEALATALKENRIRGAGLDVFATEPTGKDNLFGGFDNVLMSPHNAGVTKQCNYNMAKSAAEQWVAIFRGEKPPRLKNPEVWEHYTERYERIVGRAVAAE